MNTARLLLATGRRGNMRSGLKNSQKGKMAKNLLHKNLFLNHQDREDPGSYKPLFVVPQIL
jgi:hypothetical protein